MLKRKLTVAVLCIIAMSFAGIEHFVNAPRRLEILLLGHKSKHHDSEQLADILSQAYFHDGINISYTTNPDDLNENVLKHYDGLILYANHDRITPSQEKALLDFVRDGKGFIPLHSASWCFRNSDEVVELIGGQFKTHKTDSFPAVIVKPTHPVVKDIPAFETWDETYVHDKISKNIEVLTERVEGDHREPYTWVRNYGKGRVFYTAYGHDQRTFNNPDFQKLVKNGILWAVGDAAAAAVAGYKAPELRYQDANVPNYERRNPAPRYQLPLSPQESMSLIQVPVGFELQLFAAEPDVVNPIYMNWDERGRLWVIETVDYPNTVRDDKGQGDDRIRILEDTNGDGKADKFTLFADKLNIPTSFTFANGGIVVAQAPHFLFLKDTNGDDKADVKETIITGWGTYDTHAGPSNLRYGLDNKIWGTVGYSGFRGKMGADSISFSQGIWHFTPNEKKVADLEFLAGTSNNTWGLGFSEEFDIFASTANNTHSVFFGIPKKYLDLAEIAEPGAEKVDAHYAIHPVTNKIRQVDSHGGFTAAAGHSIYTARTFPREYWNRIGFVNEPTGRLIHKVVLKQEGAGFKEDGDGWNMLSSSDDWVGPVQAEVGPDGNLWVVDWYDFIIQHNPTPPGFTNGKGNAYINPLRDHERGRIYRLKYKGGQENAIPKLDKNDPKGLVAALSSNNMFWRTTAQRLLVESGNTQALPELYKLVRNESVDEIGINAPAIHALWTLHGLKALDGRNKEALDVATRALNHPSGGVRRAALQVLPRTAATAQAMIKADAFNDKDFRVRLAAVLAAADIKASNEIGTALFQMAEKEENANDPWLKNALFAGARTHQQGFLAALRKKGINENPGLGEANFLQRIAMASRIQTVRLRPRFNQPVENAPDVTGKEIMISGSLARFGNPAARPANAPAGNAPGNRGGGGNNFAPRGLVVAHGDAQNGYGLYVVDNKLTFQVNQQGKPYTVTTAAELPATAAFTASLQQDGTIRLMVNNKEAGTAKTAGLFKSPLATGLRAGIENQLGDKKLGNYPDTFQLRAQMTNAKIELLDPGAMKQLAAKAAATKTTAAPKVDQTIVMRVVKDVMKYDKQVIRVKAGTTVQIRFQNPDFMQHNLVIIKPKTSEKVGAAADKMARDPNGAKLHYVPRMPEVLFATPLVNPQGNYTLTFKVPATVGDYPYVCTFPGHWRIMNGIMKVTK